MVENLNSIVSNTVYTKIENVPNKRNVRVIAGKIDKTFIQSVRDPFPDGQRIFETTTHIFNPGINHGRN